MLRKKSKNYVSEIDIFLHEYNRINPKSSSQLAEIQKYQRVYALRDHPIANKVVEEDFLV